VIINGQVYVGDSAATIDILNFGPAPTPTSTPTMAPSFTRTPTPRPSPSGTSTPSPAAGTAIGITGQIHYYANPSLSVNGATVQLQNMTVGAESTTAVTDSLGQFSFPGIGSSNWEVSPQKSGDLGNAIDVIDAVTILESTVGAISLTAGQQLACDVSGDGTVNIIDAVLVLQYTVGLIARFPVAQTCNSDWAFVPGPAPATNQRVLPPQIASGVCRNGAIAFSPLTASANNQNFSGVLFGDCTGSWQPSARVSALALTTDASGAVSLGHPTGRRGHRVRVPLLVHSLRGFSALSVQIGYDPSRLRAVGVRALGSARQALTQFNPRAPGSLKIALASGNPLPDGVVFMLDFETKDGFRGKPPVHVQDAAVR
jgi:hypothetical protein